MKGRKKLKRMGYFKDMHDSSIVNSGCFAGGKECYRGTDKGSSICVKEELLAEINHFGC